MLNFNRRRTLLIIFLALSLILLTSCRALGQEGFGSQSNDYKDFFTGYDGIYMNIPPGAYPEKVYFYENPLNVGDNRFLFNIEVHNRGSADSIGGIYVSGYDPSFVEIEGVEISENNNAIDCDLGLDIFNGFLGGILSCTLDAFMAQLGCASANDITECSGEVSVNLQDADWAPDWLRGLTGAVGYDPVSDRVYVDMDYGSSIFASGFEYNGREALAYLTTFYGGIFNDFWINRQHGKVFALLGDRLQYPGGEAKVVDFNAEVINWPENSQILDQIFQFTSCYAYTTYIDPMVCIDPFPDSGSSKVCRPGTITYPRGQGAPVAITRIDQDTTPRSTIFTIHIENKGGGLIYRPTSMHKCDPYDVERVTQADLNKVHVGRFNLASSADLEIRCNPRSMEVVLDRNGKGQITCEIPHRFNIKTAYTTPLSIALWYMYSETETRQVRFIKGD